MKNKFLVSLLLLALALPMFAFALGDPDAGAIGTDNFPKVEFADWIDTLLTIIFVFIIFGAIVFILYAAWLFATAQGDPGKVEKAKTIIFWVVIAVIVTALAWGVVKWLVEKFGGSLN